MKAISINKISEKIIKGEYLLIYIFIYIITFGFVEYSAEKEYLGRFYLDPGLSLLNLTGTNFTRGDLRKINDKISAFEFIKIPKKYRNDHEITLIYISGKTEKEVLDRSKELLNFIDIFKSEKYSTPSAIEIINKRATEQISIDYKEYYDLMSNAKKNFRYLFNQASNEFKIYEGMEIKEKKRISRECSSKEKLHQINSLCTSYIIYEYLKKLEEDLSNIQINGDKLLIKSMLTVDTYIFEGAKYVGNPNIEIRTINQVYSLAFLLSTLGITLVVLVKLLKVFARKRKATGL